MDSCLLFSCACASPQLAAARRSSPQLAAARRSSPLPAYRSRVLQCACMCAVWSAETRTVLRLGSWSVGAFVGWFAVGWWPIKWPFQFTKRRSRVLRRRMRQAALDKPRVHDGQWRFAILEQKVCNGCESCLRREASLSFFTESRDHGGVKTSERKSGAGGGGGEREVKIRRCYDFRTGRVDKEN